jgi:hypothetical protein
VASQASVEALGLVGGPAAHAHVRNAVGGVLQGRNTVQGAPMAAGSTGIMLVIHLAGKPMLGSFVPAPLRCLHILPLMDHCAGISHCTIHPSHKPRARSLTTLSTVTMILGTAVRTPLLMVGYWVDWGQ